MFHILTIIKHVDILLKVKKKKVEQCYHQDVLYMALKIRIYEGKRSKSYIKWFRS